MTNKKNEDKALYDLKKFEIESLEKEIEGIRDTHNLMTLICNNVKHLQDVSHSEFGITDVSKRNKQKMISSEELSKHIDELSSLVKVTKERLFEQYAYLSNHFNNILKDQ